MSSSYLNERFVLFSIEIPYVFLSFCFSHCLANGTILCIVSPAMELLLPGLDHLFLKIKKKNTMGWYGLNQHFKTTYLFPAFWMVYRRRGEGGGGSFRKIRMASCRALNLSSVLGAPAGIPATSLPSIGTSDEEALP